MLELNHRQLTLAPSKCEHLRISHVNFALRSNNNGTIANFQFDCQVLPVAPVSKVKDLGVLISSDLKWSYHVFHLHCSCASSRAYQILHFFC